MDSEKMKRVGLYLDKDLVNRADDMVKQFHFKSRNEFFAEAVENSRNYEGISWEFPLNDVINAYPKSKGSLSVSLKNNRISAGERKSAYDFLCEQFKTAKMGKTVFALEDIQYHGLYADTKFMKPYEFGTLTTSGTCYLAVSLNPVKQKEYGNYKTVPVKVIVTKPEYEEIFFDEYWTYGTE